jgi:large subunit ribosomal protein L31e
MAKKKVLEAKVEKVEEPIVEEKPAKKSAKKSSKKSTKAAKEELVQETSTEKEGLEEKVDAFDLDAVPSKEVDQPSEVEQEIAEEKPEFDEEIQEERIYNIPLAKLGYKKAPNWRRAEKAVKVLKAFASRHMKPEGEIYISQEVNERLWENGIKNPPRMIRLKFTKSVDGIVRAYLA